MQPCTDEGPLPRLDALLRRAGEWLLVGYTVVMVLVTIYTRLVGSDRLSG